MDHCIFRVILKKRFCTLIIILISNIVGNIFLRSSISRSKSLESLVLELKVYKKVFHSFQFPSPKAQPNRYLIAQS